MSIAPVHATIEVEQRLYAGDELLKSWKELRNANNLRRNIQEAHSEFSRMYNDPLRQYNRIRTIYLQTLIQGKAVRTQQYPDY
jgi:hypothetical protein